MIFNYALGKIKSAVVNCTDSTCASGAYKLYPKPVNRRPTELLISSPTIILGKVNEHGDYATLDFGSWILDSSCHQDIASLALALSTLSTLSIKQKSL
jgi:hypothetical protein